MFKTIDHVILLEKLSGYGVMDCVGSVTTSMGEYRT